MQEFFDLSSKKSFKTRILEIFLDLNKDYRNFEEVLLQKKTVSSSFQIYLNEEKYNVGIEMKTSDKKYFISDYSGNKSYIKDIKNFSKDIEKFVQKTKENISDKKGSIYLITDGKYTKIGATSYNVKKRLNELQTGNAKLLKIIYSYKVNNKMSTEKFLHKMFEEKNVLGEWFELGFEDINYIITNKFFIENKKFCLDIEKEKVLKEYFEDLTKTHDIYIHKIFKRFKNKMYKNLKDKENNLNSKERFYIKQIKANINNTDYINKLLKGSN